MGLRSSAAAWVAAALAGFAVAMPAQAADAAPLPEPGPWNVGVYGGVYLPDRDVVDDAATYGLRVGHPFADHFVASLAAGYASLDGHRSHDGITKDANIDLTLVDGEVGYVVDPGARFSLTTAVGIGWAFAGGRVKTRDVEGPIGRSNADDSFTASVSIGPLIELTDRMSLRIVARARWFEALKNDEIDREIVAGLLFGLGGGR